MVWGDTLTTFSTMLSRVARASTRYSRVHTVSRRSYQFGSTPYVSCFGDIPSPSFDDLREKALNYLKEFDGEHWHTDPVATLLNGVKIEDGKISDTVDAFEKVRRGSQDLRC